MIDLHTHSLWSDGQLVPAEHIRRAVIAGYEAIAITDHTDASNIETLCKESIKFSKLMNKIQNEIIVLSGVELTHIIPEEIKDLAAFARGQGISIVVVHGETIVEPVRPGTNRAAIEAKVDILGHPGLITQEEVIVARNNGVCLEISAKKGHSLTNGHVAKIAIENNAKMVIDTDSHSGDDFISNNMAEKILKGAGIPENYLVNIFNNSRELVKKAMKE